jgi:hypothetical protein
MEEEDLVGARLSPDHNRQSSNFSYFIDHTHSLWMTSNYRTFQERQSRETIHSGYLQVGGQKWTKVPLSLAPLIYNPKKDNPIRLSAVSDKSCTRHWLYSTKNCVARRPDDSLYRHYRTKGIRQDLSGGLLLELYCRIAGSPFTIYESRFTESVCGFLNRLWFAQPDYVDAGKEYSSVELSSGC